MSSYRQYKKEFKKNKEKSDKDRKEQQAIASMEKTAALFMQRRGEYLDCAKKALADGDESAYNRYVSLTKNIMFQKAQIDDMLTNYQMARDLRDMGRLRGKFSDTVDEVMKDVASMSDSLNLKKTEMLFNKGIDKNSKAAQDLQDLLELNGAHFSSYADKVSGVSEDDLKYIIESELARDDADIDARLSALEAELKMDTDMGEAKKVVMGPSSTPSHPFSAKSGDVRETPEPAQDMTPKAKEDDNPIGTGAGGNRGTRTDGISAEDKVLESGDGSFRFDWDSLPSIGFDDIAGLDAVKDAVRIKVLLPLQEPEMFEGYENKGGGGLLLYGPPGTGKTMIAAAIANEIGAKFCSVKPSDLLNQGAGNTEKAVRTLFAEARSFPCAVIYFDEMDSICPKNTKSQYGRQLRSELLAQIQGVESYGKDTGNILFLIAATNKPWDVDSAFIRPGRFGIRVYVGLPDAPAREYMVERRLSKLRSKGIVNVADDVDVTRIVDETNGFNGADMTNLLDRAEEISALRCMRLGMKEINADDFERALSEISSSVQREDIEKLLEWKRNNE